MEMPVKQVRIKPMSEWHEDPSTRTPEYDWRKLEGMIVEVEEGSPIEPKRFPITTISPDNPCKGPYWVVTPKSTNHIVKVLTGEYNHKIVRLFYCVHMAEPVEEV